jgi:hypothetical protein
MLNSERYTHNQAVDEAKAITGFLNEKYPEQGGAFSKEQYDEAHASETKEIYKTAVGTLADLAMYANVPGAIDILRLLEDEGFSSKTAGKPHQVELRYRVSENIIKEAVESIGAKQAIELGSGFTPHAIGLMGNPKVLENYVEIDFAININKKRDLIKKLAPELDVSFVSGDVFDEKVWGGK